MGKDQLFRPVVKGLHRELPDDNVQRDLISRPLPSLSYSHGKLFYEKNVFLPRYRMKDVPYAARVASVAGSFELRNAVQDENVPLAPQEKGCKEVHGRMPKFSREGG